MNTYWTTFLILFLASSSHAQNNSDPDCNSNGTLDSEDIASGYSSDCDQDGVPDECQVDCNNNGIPDVCELFQGDPLTQNFEGAEGSEMLLFGPAYIDEDPNTGNSYLVLTPDGGDYHGYGVFSEVRDVSRVNVYVDYSMSGTADGIYVHFIDAETNAIDPPWNSRVLSVFLDTYQNSWDPDSNNVDVNWDSTPLATYSPSFDMNEGSWRGFTVELEENLLTVTMGNGEVAFNQLVLPDSFDFSQAYIAVHGAGNSQVNLVDNVTVTFPSGDCNLNGILDECEITADSSLDCNGNGILDICEGLEDCNGNGILDICEGLEDCNGNGIPDECDIESGFAFDCNHDGVPDSCEDSSDRPDCDGDGVPDECELADGTQFDSNANGIPDDCECPVWTYCPSNGNSVGDGVQLTTEGSACLDTNEIVFVGEGGPIGQASLLFYGAGTANQPFGSGVRCVAGPIYRLGPPVFFGGAGHVEVPVDMSQGPTGAGPGEISYGSTWYFQMWYRDPAADSWGFNLSNGLQITFGS